MGFDPSLVYSRSPPLSRSPPDFPSAASLPTLYLPVQRPQVLGPVNRAIDMVVNELGFATEDAK